MVATHLKMAETVSDVRCALEMLPTRQKLTIHPGCSNNRARAHSSRSKPGDRPSDARDETYGGFRDLGGHER